MAKLIILANDNSDIKYNELLAFTKKNEIKYGLYLLNGDYYVDNTRGLISSFKKYKRNNFISKLENAMMQLGIIPEYRFENNKENNTEQDFSFDDGQKRLTVFNLSNFDSDDWEYLEFISFMKKEGWERIKPGNVFIKN